MATNVFVSFDHDDQNQVNGFRLIGKNPNHPLEMHDHSLKEPVTDRFGRPIKYSPSDPRSQPVREEITAKMNKCSKLVVLIGDDTHRSDWVEWEINNFIRLKKPIAGDLTWKRIRGMKLKGADSATMPEALMNGKSTKELLWNPDSLATWLDSQV